MFFQESGDKTAPLMVFLHGGGVSGWMWDKQMKAFLDYHCIVVDLPGHGRSLEDEFSIRGSAEKVIQLIEEKADHKPVIAIGFSLGSQVLIQMMSLKPDLIDYAIINSALVRPMAGMKKWIRLSVKMTYPLVKKQWFAKLQARTLYIGDELFDKYFAESKGMKQETLIQVLEENMSFSIPSAFSQASGKILVTVGAKERRVMKKSLEDLVRVNANCSGIMISNIGHGAPLGKADFFNQMVRSWVEEGEVL